MVTGESRPVARGPGDRVVAGTVSTDSSIRVRVDAVGDDTALAGIQRLAAEAQASGSRAQALADRFAALLSYVAAGAGALTFLAWAGLGRVDDGVVRTVTVLVIACPHALGLAIPLVVSLSTAVSARAGILVKDRLALERMRDVDAVLFDKTGTLTKGEHTVTGVAGVGIDESEILSLAGAVESDSEHPLARAIAATARARGELPSAQDFRSITGRGVEASVDGRRYAVGGPALLRERGLEEPAQLADEVAAWKARGAAVLYLVREDVVAGALALEDEIRPEARAAVEELHRLGIRVVMITGDARQVAEAVAAELGVDEVFAEVLPEDKDAAVAELQERGRTVAMVGDGVNDAPALARADVGIAIGAGTDVAIESAGVVLASSDPRGVVGVIRLSKSSYRKMLQNLTWAAGYNIVAIPLAAGPVVGGHRPGARRRCSAHERLHHRRGPQRPAPAPAGPAPRTDARAALGTGASHGDDRGLTPGLSMIETWPDRRPGRRGPSPPSSRSRRASSSPTTGAWRLPVAGTGAGHAAPCPQHPLTPVPGSAQRTLGCSDG